MKTEFLKELGITDQTVIDAIMAENGKNINSAKGEVDNLKTQVADLQSQLTERDTQLTELKKDVKDNEKLTNKITELETANNNTKTEYENKLKELQKTHAIESGVREAKAKNVKAVMALLDMEKITFNDGKIGGLTEQLDALSKDAGSSFMFEETKPNNPHGTNPSNPPNNNNNNPPTSNSWQEAIAKHFGSGQ